LIIFPFASSANFGGTLLGMLASKGIFPVIGSQVDHASTALAMVSIGLGVCVVPQSVAVIQMPGVSFRPLDIGGLTAGIECAYLRNSQSRVLPALLSIIRSNGGHGENDIGRQPDTL
jgi:DNA-binding transcriptional LysR family regulator